MLKKIAFAGVGIALLVSPLLASADTASEIQAKINILLAQIAQLQQQLSSLRTTTPVEPVQPIFDPAPPSRICPQILRTLDQGISGDDVKEVQAFLGVSQTGYFGPMTAKAVAAFQADEGLSQVGIIGPMTRAAFARRCGWGDHNSTFSASPTSGAAPLTVNFNYPADNGNDLAQYAVSFGDGTSGQMQFIVPPCAPPGPGIMVPPNYCRGSFSTSHTYTANGTYTAQLIKSDPGGCPGNISDPSCLGAPASREIVGTVTISVGGNTSDGPRLAPQSDTAGVIGAPVSIIGTGFTPGNTNNVYFGDPAVPGGPTLAAANLAPMSGDGKFQTLFFTIPSYIAVGTYPVSVGNANGSSGTNDTNGNPVTYRVRTGPTISSISPSPAPVGSSIAISGKGFDQQLVNVDILSTTGQEMQVTGATPTYNGTQVSIVLNPDRVPAGQYLLSVRNVGPGTPFGGVASRAVSLTVTAPTNTPAITVTSPNGGERLDIGSQKTITWRDGRTFIQANPYDVFLDRTMPQCGNPLMGCPMMMPVPLTIAKGVTGNSWQWTVGKVIEPSGAAAGAGDYTVRVCDSGSQVSCDSSDQYFTIADSVYEGNKPPEIKSFIGPTSLGVGEKGTWVVQAFDPEGKELNYSFSWCDVPGGRNGVCTAQAYPAGAETVNVYTTNFPAAGTYEVSVFVSDEVGKSARASATVTVAGSDTACEVTDIYAEGVPGYMYYNLFMKVRNLPGATTKMPVVAITGAESWDNLTFSQVGYSSGVTTLQASQTVNAAGINYIMERKYNIKPISNGTSIGTTPIICTPMGGSGIGYPVPVPSYPTQTSSTGVQSSAASNTNIANALTALELALKAIIAKLGR